MPGARVLYGVRSEGRASEGPLRPAYANVQCRLGLASAHDECGNGREEAPLGVPRARRSASQASTVACVTRPWVTTMAAVLVIVCRRSAVATSRSISVAGTTSISSSPASRMRTGNIRPIQPCRCSEHNSFKRALVVWWSSASMISVSQSESKMTITPLGRRTRASSRIESSLSSPMTRPSGPTSLAISLASSPVPHPTSRTVSPECKSSISVICFLTLRM